MYMHGKQKATWRSWCHAVLVLMLWQQMWKQHHLQQVGSQTRVNRQLWRKSWDEWIHTHLTNVGYMMLLKALFIFFWIILGHIHHPKNTMHHTGHFFQLHGNALAHHLVKSHMIVRWPCSPIQWTTPGTVCTRMLQGKVSGMSSDNATTSPEHLGFGEAFKVDGLSGWWLQHQGDVTELYIDWMIMNGIRSIQICC